MTPEAPFPRVLIVDDYADSAESVARWLELDGFETLIARDGAEALERVRRWQPQVCIVDLQMPKVDGFELAQQLRAQPGGEQTVLIAHTGHAGQEARDRAHEAGFDEYFTKPTEPQEILRVIEDRTARRRLGA